jgi:alcohol dehydrogenase, propanol-preferring
LKAQLLYKPDDIKNKPLLFEDVSLPTMGAGEVLLKVNACAICRTDLHVVEGELPVRKTPIIPGHQVVGSIENMRGDVAGFQIGDRVGVAWLQSTCGMCRFCTSGRENLCDKAVFTGWTAHGGYAEYMAVPAQFLYKIPDAYTDVTAAPLLCAGIIGYRALSMMKINDWRGRRIGIYGFGAAGHIVIQLLQAMGAEVYVCTRDQRHRNLAAELGATWVGGTIEKPPVLLDAAVVFAPAGEIVPAGLEALDKDGRLVLSGIHMSPIPGFSYDLLYGERVVRSVTNNTRQNGVEFLGLAAKFGIQVHTETFPLSDANDALYALKYDAFQGAGVLVL